MAAEIGQHELPGWTSEMLNALSESLLGVDLSLLDDLWFDEEGEFSDITTADFDEDTIHRMMNAFKTTDRNNRDEESNDHLR